MTSGDQPEVKVHGARQRKTSSGRRSAGLSPSLAVFGPQLTKKRPLIASAGRSTAIGVSFLHHMSDTTTATPTPNAPRPISTISETVIRIAGDSQDGIQ